MLIDNIEDRIALAGNPAEVDETITNAWRDHTHGRLTMNDMEALQEAARARREALGEHRTQTRPKPCQAASDAPAASARRHGHVWPPKRPRQRSPDRQASLDRRWRLFNELPHEVRLLFRDQPGKGAVVAVIRQRIQERGYCDLSVPELAATAGVSDRTVQQATHEQLGLILFVVSPRRRGYYNDPNVITLTAYGKETLLQRVKSAAGHAGKCKKEGLSEVETGGIGHVQSTSARASQAPEGQGAVRTSRCARHHHRRSGLAGVAGPG